MMQNGTIFIMQFSPLQVYEILGAISNCFLIYLTITQKHLFVSRSSSSLFDLGRNNRSYNVTVHHCSTEVMLLYVCVPGDGIRVGQFAPSFALRWWFPQKKGGDDFMFSSATVENWTLLVFTIEETGGLFRLYVLFGWMVFP